MNDTSKQRFKTGIETQSNAETDDNRSERWEFVLKKSETDKSEVKEQENYNQKTEETFPLKDKLGQTFVRQQEQNTKHRTKLMGWFTIITCIQLFVINVLIFITIFFKTDFLNEMLGFLSFFIGATFAELLGGLLIIVKFVFSHEAFGMLKHLILVDPTQNKENE